MELDPLDTVNSLNESEVRDRASARLNIWVAITVALLATFMGICKVKDDNIVQTMQQAQANKIDHWGYYQARNIREKVIKKMARYSFV
jgi:formiminotetrahydrofolate cyclodeaminase